MAFKLMSFNDTFTFKIIFTIYLFYNLCKLYKETYVPTKKAHVLRIDEYCDIQKTFMHMLLYLSTYEY